MMLMHGLNFIRLKTTGDLRKRARDWNSKLYYLLYAGEVVFAVLLFFMTDFFKERPISTLLILVVIVGSTVAAHIGVLKDNEVLSFIGSALGLVGVVGVIFNGLFPRVMIGQNAAMSILAKDASASPLTLTIMTIVAVILLPIALAYFIWSYVVFHKRIQAKGAVSE